MGTIAEAFIRQGRQEGRQEGEHLEMQKGEALGMQKEKSRALTRLLERRFGALPEAVREQAAAASPAQIDAWFDAAIEAESLDDIFDT